VEAQIDIDSEPIHAEYLLYGNVFTYTRLAENLSSK
jgi:hypothetical protein